VKYDIDAEKSSVREEDPNHLLYLVRFFLEYQRKTAAIHSLALLSTIVNVQGLFFLMKNIRIAFDENNFSRIFMAVDCLKHFLLTIQFMYKHDEEEIRNLAHNLLDNLYYEKSNMDLIIDVLKGVKKQSKEFLIVSVESIHLILKLLEGFASTKSSLVVRHKRRKKNRSEDQDPIARGMETLYDSEPDYVEKEINFSRIELQFCNSRIIEMYMKLMVCFRELPSSVVHALGRMMYRIAVKLKKPHMFYKLNYLCLFHDICQDKSRASSKFRNDEGNCQESFSELQGIAKYVVRMFFENFQKFPLLLIEIFFPQSHGDRARVLPGNPLKCISPESCLKWNTEDEIEVKKGFSEQMQVQIVVSALVSFGKTTLLHDLTKQLTIIFGIREGNEVAREGGCTLHHKCDLIEPHDHLHFSNSAKTSKEFGLLLNLIGVVQNNSSAIGSLNPQHAAQNFNYHSENLFETSLPRAISTSRLSTVIEWILGGISSPVRYKNKPAYRFLKLKQKRCTKRLQAENSPEIQLAKDLTYFNEYSPSKEDQLTYRKENGRPEQHILGDEISIASCIADRSKQIANADFSKTPTSPKGHPTSSSEEESLCSSSSVNELRDGSRVLPSKTQQQNRYLNSCFTNDTDSEDEFSRRLSALRVRSSERSARSFFYEEVSTNDPEKLPLMADSFIDMFPAISDCNIVRSLFSSTKNTDPVNASNSHASVPKGDEIVTAQQIEWHDDDIDR
jgi:hypothetical protein